MITTTPTTPTTTPRRGRPPRPIDPTTLPPVARVLWTAAAKLAHEDRERVRLAIRVANPGVLTVGVILAAIRPGDKDGGWGWFGRQLAKLT